MTNDQSVQEIFKEAMEARGLGVDKLAEHINVPPHYIAAILMGQVEKLPAAPYARNYVLKMAEVLNVDGESLWQRYKREYPLKSSGAEDAFPTNRFAVKSLNKGVITICVLAVAVVGYLAWQYNELLGSPQIELLSPTEDVTLLSASAITLRGIVDPDDKLEINGEEVMVAQDGNFEKNFSLQSGLNTIEFRVSRLLGKETVERRQVIYEPTIDETKD